VTESIVWATDTNSTTTFDHSWLLWPSGYDILSGTRWRLSYKLQWNTKKAMVWNLSESY